MCYDHVKKANVKAKVFLIAVLVRIKQIETTLVKFFFLLTSEKGSGGRAHLAGDSTPTLHRWLQTVGSRWNWYLFEISKNIQFYEVSWQLQRLSEGSVGISVCGKYFCGQKYSQLKNHNTFQQLSGHQSAGF